MIPDYASRFIRCDDLNGYLALYYNTTGFGFLATSLRRYTGIA